MNRNKLVIGLIVLIVGLAVVTMGFIMRDESTTGNAQLQNEEFSLPPVNENVNDVTKAIFNRRSVRSYSERPISREHLGTLLWSAIGITTDTVTGPTRAAPSAGATNPLSVYAFIEKADDIAPGIYKYEPETHQLKKVKAGLHNPELRAAALDQSAIEDAPVNIVLSAHYPKTTERYGDRGINYVHYEAGHAAQNINLVAKSLGMGSVIIGAFDDNRVKNLLDENPGNPLLIIPVGWQP